MLDFILTTGDRVCFSFAFRIISTSLDGLYKTSEDQGQLKRKSVNSNKIALCENKIKKKHKCGNERENKIDWALAFEFLLNYRATVRAI